MTTAVDPVCGMRIDEAESFGAVRFEGHTYHFCSELCRAKFDADAERYAVGGTVASARP
jgi:P-type Cu+ transporter